MQFRSWLIVPGDQEKKLAVASTTGADVVVLDLECPPTREGKMYARQQVAAWLQAHRETLMGAKPLGRWVRLNTLESRLWRDDLIAVMPGAPDGVILPKTTSPESVREIAAEIYELEPRYGVTSGSVKIMPVVGEGAKSAMTISSYMEASLPRFAGLSWGTKDLSLAIGALRHREGKGGLTDVFRYVRAQTLLTAHACGVMAIDRLCDALPADDKAAKLAAADARADGFTGMFACHPAQVRAINAAFTPSEAEVAQAKAVLAAIETASPSGETSIDRRLINRPDVQQAKRVLETVAVPSKRAASVSLLRPA